MKILYRLFVKPLLYVIIILVCMLVVFYLMSPVYEFSEPRIFSGSKLHNPYENMDSSAWKRYNFQVQSKAWGGITDGRKNSNQLIDSVYNLLGFDYVATSDYQKINNHGKENPSFIPTYEHGYNIFKTHQVCIGAKEVLWTDLILFQTTSMKQWVIDQLNKDCEIISLAHPLLKHGYTLEDMRYLTNYQMMEVLNNMRISTEHWDVALSSGQVVWIMGNDDAHDVLNPNHVGRKFTMINSPTTNRDDIIKNLKMGNNYGVDFYPKMDVPLNERIERIKNVPVVKTIYLSGDTLTVGVNQIAQEIHFIGQNGIIRHTGLDTATSSYLVKEDDSYIRTVFKFADGTSIYLNPIIRHEGEYPVSLHEAKVDGRATLILRIVYFVIILVLVYFIRRRKQAQSSNNK